MLLSFCNYYPLGDFPASLILFQLNGYKKPEVLFCSINAGYK